MPEESFVKSLKDLTSTSFSNDRVVIQVKNQDMTYSVNFDSNYEDRGAYIVGLSKFIEETSVLNKFNTIIEDGWNHFASMIYTWRSISYALPPAPDDQTKGEYYIACLDLYSEEIVDLCSFYDFINNRAKPTFIKECHSASSVLQRSDFLTTGILEGLSYFSEMLFSLDILKDAKVSTKNDFTNFKRMAQIEKSYASDLDFMKNSEKLNFLSLFLAQNQQIMTLIKSDLQKLNGYEDVLCEVLDYVCYKIEEKQYFVPQDKFKLIRAIVAVLNFLDNPNIPINKLDKQKKLSLSRIDKILKETPIVPIVGDMQLNAPFQIKKISTIDYNKYFTFYDTSHQKQLELKNSPQTILKSLEENYYSITGELARGRTLLSKEDSSNESVRYTSALNHTFNPDVSKTLYTIACNAFTLLSRMSENLILVYSWKMSNPRFRNVNSDEVDDPYFARTKENYTAEEKTAMVTLITLVKALFNQLNNMEVILTPPILCHVYSEIQAFINKTIADLLNKVSKSGKNDLLRVMLTGIRSTCGDLVENMPMYGTRKKIVSNKSMVANMRCVGPLSTQIYTLNNFLKTALRSKEFRKELDNNTVQLFHEFSSKLHIFWSLMNYAKTLRASCDLSMFWFREFYLEMTNGKRIQYPIETSLPWIFASHVIESSDASITENLMYILDLYNDSAQYTLTHLKRKYLYDEIEAEVNLIFEQLVHMLSERIYTYYRHVASSIYYDKSVKGILTRYLKSIKKDLAETQFVEYAKDHRYKTLLNQHSIHVLGREVDLANLIAQRMILALRKSLEVAFSIFMSKGIDNIHEFDNLIEITKLTHSVLSEHLNLPPFRILYAEANCLEEHKIPKFVMHVLTDIVSDVIPNFAYCSINERFVRGKITYSNNVVRRNASFTTPTHLYGNKHMSFAYGIYTDIFNGYIGIEHFCLIMKYAEYGGLAEFVDQITNFVRTLITEKFSFYIGMIKSKMPDKISLPRHQYGLVGSIRYYKANFNHIINYSDLYPRIFQCMREIGNCFLLVKSFEDAVRHNEMFQCLFGAVYQGIVPKCDDQSKRNPLLTQSTIQQFASLLSDPSHIENLSASQMFTTENLTFGVSIFDYVLYNVKHALSGDPWDRKFPNNAVVAFDECKDYYRIFSILCLAMAHPPPVGDESIDKIFGDGLLWCGEVIVALLGESSLASSSDFLHHLMEVENYVTIEHCISNHMFGSRPNSRIKNLTLDNMEQDEEIQFIMPRIRAIDNRRKRITAFISRFLTGPYCQPAPSIRCFSTPTYKRPAE